MAQLRYAAQSGHTAVGEGAGAHGPQQDNAGMREPLCCILLHHAVGCVPVSLVIRFNIICRNVPDNACLGGAY